MLNVSRNLTRQVATTACLPTQMWYHFEELQGSAKSGILLLLLTWGCA